MGQTERKSEAAAIPRDPQTVSAQQSGAWTVGIDPTKNLVNVTNTASDPLSVKLVGTGPTRKPFQFRTIITPSGTDITTVNAPIPAGKRLVIENISAVARTPEGVKMELRFQTAFDNGDGVGNSLDITLHRIALTDQGTFAFELVGTANHKVLVFADEVINGEHFQIAVQARLQFNVSPGTAQAQITFSGWVEDLPVVP